MSSEVKAVVTGASGFLGKNLVEAMRNDGRFRVFALSSRPEELRDKMAAPNISFHSRTAVLEEAGKDILAGSVIINCAYPRNSKGTSVADGLKYLQSLFAAAAENGCSAVINISSQSVYPPERTEPATEKTRLSLDSPYAVGKYAVELMLESICAGTQTLYSNIRMASLIGPGFDQRIVNRFVKMALEKGELTVNRNRQRFGFFDVSDAVRALLLMLETEPGRWEKVYNLGGTTGYSLMEIADTVRDVILETDQKNIRISVTGSDPAESGGEERTSTMINEAFARDFGFSPSTDLRESIRRIRALQNT